MTIVIVFANLIIGCATQKATINTYVDPTYEKDSIKSIAVFPIRNTRFAPSESQEINRKISTAINRYDPNINLMSSAEATRILNENDLADDWAVFLDNFFTSGIPDLGILRQVGLALKVNAILQGEIVNIKQEDGEIGGNAGTTRVTVRFSMIDTEKGKLLWEASSDGIRTDIGYITAPPIIEAVNLAVDKIMESLPIGTRPIQSQTPNNNTSRRRRNRNGPGN